MAKEDEDPDPSTPTPKRKVSNINNGAGTTPTKRTPITGPRTPTTARKTSAQKNATPIRKASANNKTPNSAPLAKAKKAEPTLLGDFLLGRPSPGRRSVNNKNATTARRKSLDAVKAEMRVNNVERMQQPGKVQERVKQWQKSNAKAGEQEVEKGLDDIVVEYETDSEVEVRKPERKSRTPEPRLRGGDASSPRPGRRKERDSEPKEKEPEKQRSKSAAPKKRVISDEHWMKNRRRSPPGKGSTIPKNFLQATAINPPVERKIEDWVKRMASPEPPERVETPKRKVRRAESEESEEKPRSRKVSRRSPTGHGVRAQPSRTPSPEDGIRIKPSKDRPSRTERRSTSLKPEPNDGIRMTPSPQDDGIRIRPSDAGSVRSEIQIKRTRNDGSKRRPKDEGETPTPSPRKKSEHLAPPTEAESRSRKTSYTTTVHDDDATSYLTSSPSKRKNRKSDVTESLDEIPFGNSAFSVLDLPVGAEANTMKRAERPEPKRNNSFAAVPKVLKRVYTEGMKRVHDPEPPRGGPNQPPSIETWLNGTTDPFIERPSTAGASLPVPEAPVSRMRSFKEDDHTEHELTAEREHKPIRSIPKKEDNSPASPLRRGDNRETLPSMGTSPPVSPLGLKRTGATRTTSSPKAGKKFGLKNAIFDAFKGESAMAKTVIPTPFDFIGVRVDEITNTETESSIVSDFEEVPRKPSPKTSPRTSERSTFETVESKATRPAHSYTTRPPPVAGGPSLSTIASVTSYSNSSSATSDTGTGSELSHTTITQDTVLSRNTGSSLSRGSKKSTSKKEEHTGHTSLKRCLTTHEDLVSMLSLPDSPQPKKSGSIRSVRSVRTRKPPIEDATIEDLLREVGEDEIKYMRELNTLVDGVIPVLLTCVLSKSDSAVAAGLFEPLAYGTSGSDSSFTKPIVDMGIALERLKSLHKRISLTDPDSFLLWAQQSVQIYEDYLRAWRTGFEDVVVNLAPASRKASLTGEQDMDSLPVNQRGDVIKESGEVVDVAHLLKAPMRRVKVMIRGVKGIAMHRPTELAKAIETAYEKLNNYRQERVKAEHARKEDMKAYMTDSTLARDPKTLEPAEDVTIERFRQVNMKDMFGFDMWHSNGQRIECEVELTFRKDMAKIASDHDLGDILISQSIDGKNCLLFPPINMYNISARVGDKESEIVVMIRGLDGSKTWSELIVLDADVKEVADEWLDVLPMKPVPGIIVRKTKELDPEVSSMISAPGVDLKSVVGTLKKKIPQQPPIGERRRREYEDAGYAKKHDTPEQPASPELPHMLSSGPMTSARKRLDRNTLKNLSTDNVYNLKSLNEEMVRVGSKPLRRFKNEPNPDSPFTSPWVVVDSKIELTMSGALAIHEDEQESNEVINKYTANGQDSIGRTLHVPKLRSPTPKSSTPLTESMRPDFETITKNRPTTPRDDGAPPPPAHRNQVTPPALKNTPVIDSPTPKNKNRRGSSPLKHEYQPSADSAASSVAEDTYNSDDYTSSDLHSPSSEDSIDELDDDELAEIADEARTLPSHSMIHGRDDWHPASTESLAPSNSASQVPAVQVLEVQVKQFVAMVSYWKNQWVDVHKDACIINVGPGWVDVYEPDNEYASRDRDGFDDSTTSLIDPGAAVMNPLLSQELTPNVHIRASTAVDVQVRSPLSHKSRFKKSAGNIQYRFINPQVCMEFFNAMSVARSNNKKWNHLSYQRNVEQFGADNESYYKRRSWFSRKGSFRRGAEQVNSVPASVGDSGTSSPLKRFRGGGLFNIGRSSVFQKAGGMSAYTSSSGFSNVSPPETPSGSQAPSGSLWGSTRPLTGSKDLPIILHRRASDVWVSLGQATITISEPTDEQRKVAYRNQGCLRHIVVTLRPVSKSKQGRVILDEVLGADCFSAGGVKGIYITILREMVDERGVVGAVPSRGGVSGTTERWCLQSKKMADTRWINTLLKSVVGMEGM